MEIVWIILVYVCVIIGIIGSVIPILPGPPVAFLGMLIYKLCPLGEGFSWWWLVLGGVLTLLAVVLEYYIPIAATKRYGGSKYGVYGATIGIIVGLFFPPFGFLFGPFLGALIGELLNDYTNHKGALRASWGSFVGFLFSVGFNMLVCGIIVAIISIHLMLE